MLNKTYRQIQNEIESVYQALEEEDDHDFDCPDLPNYHPAPQRLSKLSSTAFDRNRWEVSFTVQFYRSLVELMPATLVAETYHTTTNETLRMVSLAWLENNARCLLPDDVECNECGESLFDCECYKIS